MGACPGGEGNSEPGEAKGWEKSNKLGETLDQPGLFYVVLRDFCWYLESGSVDW